MGHKSVKDCQRHITSKEFAEWMAYFSLEPFGDDLLDQHFAAQDALLANIYSPKSGRKFKPDDFALRKIPDETAHEELTNDEIFRRLKMALGLGGVKK